MDNRNEVNQVISTGALGRFTKALESIVTSIPRQKFNLYTAEDKNRIKSFVETIDFVTLNKELEIISSDIKTIDETLKKPENYRETLDRLEQQNKILSNHINKLSKVFDLLLPTQFGYLFNPPLIEFSVFMKHTVNYEKLRQNIQSIKTKAEEIIKKVKGNHIAIDSVLSQKNKEDTFKFTLHFRSEEDRNKTLFGIPSYGHMSVEFCPGNNVKRKNRYLSLYPGCGDEMTQESFMGVITNFLHIPSLDSKPGKLVEREVDYDIFPLHLTMELPCRNMLNFDAAYSWIKDLDDPLYQFYGHEGDNCSSIVLRALKQAGAERVIPYKSNNVNITTPHEVWNYINKLQIKMLNDQIAMGKDYSERQRINFILLAAAREIQCLIQAKHFEVLDSNPDNDFTSSLIPIYKSLLNLSDRALFSENLEPIDALITDIKQDISDHIIKLGLKNTNEFEEAMRILQRVHTNFFSQEILIKNINLVPLNSSGIKLIKSDGKNINKEIEALNIVNRALGDNQNTDYTVNKNDLLEKCAVIDDSICQLKLLITDNTHDNTKINIEKNIRHLKTKRGMINQHIYFDRCNVPGDKQNIFNKLQILFPVDESSRANKISDLLDKQIAKFKSVKPKIEFSYNPFQWYKNSIIEESYNTNQRLYKTLNSTKMNLNAKKILINKCIEENKPSWWAFWRSDDLQKYQDMHFHAQLSAVIQSFCQGDLDMIDFTIEMENMEKSFPGYEDKFKILIPSMMESYQLHLKETNDTTKNILGKLFRDEIKDKREVIEKIVTHSNAYTLPANIIKTCQFFAHKDPTQDKTKFQLEDIYSLRKSMNNL